MAMPMLSDDIRRFDVTGEHEVNLRRLAREIGMGILDHETIFKNHGITETVWLQVATNPRFQSMLAEEVETWGSSLNTRQRVDIKTLAMLEESLPEFWRCIHDPKFADTAKVALFTALQKGAGIGVANGVAPTGEKVSITINMGEDKKLTIEHQLQSVTLEGNAVEID